MRGERRGREKELQLFGLSVPVSFYFLRLLWYCQRERKRGIRILYIGHVYLLFVVLVVVSYDMIRTCVYVFVCLWYVRMPFSFFYHFLEGAPLIWDLPALLLLILFVHAYRDRYGNRFAFRVGVLISPCIQS